MEKVLNSNSLEEGTVKRSIILLYQQMIKKLPEYFSEQENHYQKTLFQLPRMVKPLRTNPLAKA